MLETYLLLRRQIITGWISRSTDYRQFKILHNITTRAVNNTMQSDGTLLLTVYGYFESLFGFMTKSFSLESENYYYFCCTGRWDWRNFEFVICLATNVCYFFLLSNIYVFLSLPDMLHKYEVRDKGRTEIICS
jgi:hypothetical protein